MINARNQIPFEIVLYEGKGAAPLSGDLRAALFAALLDQGYAVTRVAGGSTRTAATTGTNWLVLGDFGGRAPALEDAAGFSTIETRDISGVADTTAVLEEVEQFRQVEGAPLNRPGANGAWKPWFPVIDYERCTNCMQCLSFCLFDVYGVDSSQQIEVRNQDNCKTNCPACSRVCPEVAILFPKYSAGPINGDIVNQADLDREKMKVDISSLLGGDIYSRLRERSEAAKSRFSTERSADKALEERKKCMIKLQQSGLIPDEVLAELDLSTLPSPDEIRQKAIEAAEKARLAREAAGKTD